MKKAKEADVHGYRIEMYRDEDGSWAAEVPDLPGCVGAGDSPDEAVEMVGDAVEAWIEAAHASGRPVPAPSGYDEDFSGKFLLRVTRTLHRELARQARREGVSLNAYCSTSLATAAGLSAWIDRQALVQPFAQSRVRSSEIGVFGLRTLPERSAAGTASRSRSTLLMTTSVDRAGWQGEPIARPLAGSRGRT